MAQSLSNDLRKRIIAAVKEGASARGAARQFAVSASFATALVKRWRETGSYAAGQRGGYRRAVLLDIKDYLHELMKRHGDWSEVEIAAHVAEERGIKVHPATAGRFIRKLGYRYKKNTAGQRTRT